MAASDGVDAHVFQFHQLAPERVIVEGRTQTAEVMMVADTVELHVLAVEPETRLGVEAERSEGCRRAYGIYGLTGDDDLGEQRVDIWCVGTPQAWVAHGHLLLGAAVGNLCDDLAVAVKERVAHHRMQSLVVVVGEGDGHGHRPRTSVLCCRHDVDAPVGDVQR